MNIDPSAILGTVAIAGVIGLARWVWSLQGKIATFVTYKDLKELQSGIDNSFRVIHEQLGKLAEDVAYLRGRSEH